MARELRVPRTGKIALAIPRKPVPRHIPGDVRDGFKEAAQSDCQCKGCYWIRVHRDYDLYPAVVPLRSQELVHVAHSDYECGCKFIDGRGDTCGRTILEGAEVLWDPSHGSCHIDHFTDAQIARAKEVAAERKRRGVQRREIDEQLLPLEGL